MVGHYKVYPEYKNTDIKFLKNIPTHWVTSKVRYISSFGRGLSITKADLQDSGVPCVSYGEVHSMFGFEVDPKRHLLKCVNEGYLKTSSYALLSKGDFVFADTSEDIDGSGNFTQLISDERVFAGYHTVIVRPNLKNHYRFIAYLFDSAEFRTQIQDAVKGVKVFSITQAILKSADVWFPSYEEQQKIASFLDHETAKIDTLIAKQEKLIELLKEKRQAVISHAVTKGLNPDVPMKDSGIEWLVDVPDHWGKIAFKQIIKTRKGVAFSSSDFCDSGIRVVKASDIKQLTLNKSDVFLPEAFVNKYPKAYLAQGNIILSTVGSTPDVKNSAVGQIAIVPEELDKTLLNQNTVVFDPKGEMICRDYLFWLLQTRAYRDHLDLYAHGTANQASLNVADMLSFRCFIPPIDEQKRISEYLQQFLDKVSNLETKMVTIIELIKERKTALISAAVTGKIDVRDWDIGETDEFTR
ncbi:restriction endonuclease subunit S [Providencia sp. PROV273]|uniref:restriction endonuclease subunit S n=1 Tax=Providencia sp. PROV273 TaxID=2949960 RepID=UPI002349CF10|nr:restriction endonuclease subunit S [Providencia sp. PROV273]